MRDRVLNVACGLLILAGSLVFLNGGRQHPPSGSSLGQIGSQDYFRQFAHHIDAAHNWEAMHAQILFGPILWTLGCAGLRRRVPAADSGWCDIAVVALTIGSAAWTLAFVFDGFVAPIIARAVMEQTSLESSLLFDLRTNQVVVIRAGLVGWLFVGTAVAALGAAMLTRRPSLQLVIALLGIAIGLWPVAAWLTGEFSPGPFVSSLWRWTALVTAAWFVVVGIWLSRKPRSQAVEGLSAEC